MVSIRKIQAAFQSIAPELESRLWRCARRFQETEEVFTEMYSFAWINFRSKARRLGEFLSAGQLAFMSLRRLSSGRLVTENTVKDALAPMARRLGRTRVIYFSQLSGSKRNQALTDSTVQRITDALTASEREGPDVRAATRIDWAAFMRTLPNRLRRILRGLVVGDAKGLIAKRLGISNGRLSQLLNVLAREITAFFGPEIVPVGCVA
ncbi:MAG: hypothetical protein NTW87_07155 [Planctomycetota bacterium]|nr:hypothetical protein [Planctomycetota bacterium]